MCCLSRNFIITRSHLTNNLFSLETHKKNNYGFNSKYVQVRVYKKLYIFWMFRFPTIWCFIGVSNPLGKTSEVTRTFVGNLVVSFLTFLYSIF